jgi:hypothetical protein
MGRLAGDSPNVQRLAIKPARMALPLPKQLEALMTYAVFTMKP